MGVKQAEPPREEDVSYHRKVAENGNEARNRGGPTTSERVGRQKSVARASSETHDMQEGQELPGGTDGYVGSEKREKSNRRREGSEI